MMTMFLDSMKKKAAGWVLLLALAAPGFTLAQSNDNQASQGSQTQQQVPAAGGPQGDIGPIAVPKKQEEPPPERRTPPAKREELPNFSLRVDVPLVQVPVMVLTKNGQFIPGLKKENFKILEDGNPQQIRQFSQAEAPITAVLLVEFAANHYAFMYDALNASYAFTQMLKPEDWIAVVSYDMRPHIVVDFTQDKRAVLGGLNSLRIPGFSETNLFDALYDTIDRIEGIEGRKYIIVIGNGVDTFSRLTYDKILKRIQATKDITLFTISTGFALRELLDRRFGGRGWAGADMMTFTQADNQMRTFARMTGGQFFQPRFEGELPEIFRAVSASIRNQYMLAYQPSNNKQDGSYRKLKVELMAPDGGPLKIVDEKGKEVKFQIVAREGYRSKFEVE